MDTLRLKKIRRLRGIKQHELAEYLGISKSSIGMYEQGRREPDHKTLVKLAEFFDVSVDYLLGNDQVEKTDKNAIINQVVEELKSNPLMFMSEKLSEEDFDLLVKAVSKSIEVALEKKARK